VQAPPAAQSRLLRRLLLGALTLIIAAGLFGAIAEGVANPGPLTQLDVEISQALHRRAEPALTAVMLAVTHLHSTVAVSFYAAVLAAILTRRRQWRRLAALLLCVPGGMGVNVLMKLAFQRARPDFDDPLLSLSTYSFPSGHVAATTLLYGFGVAWVFAATARWPLRGAAVAAWVVAVLLVAFSRVYLGVHYPSDVAAAVAEGIAWLAVCLGALAAFWRESASASMPVSG